MKVIFLDIDGVLNTIESIKKSKEHYLKTGKMISQICEYKIQILSKIIELTNAKIVLSSTWKLNFRKNEEGKLIPKNESAKLLVDLLNKYSLEIYDITPNDKCRNRKLEILEYLNTHNITSFIIIDDEDNGLKETFRDNFFKVNSYYKGNIELTDEETGLQISHIEEIVKILNESKKKTLSKKLK